jgi:hypothetical protein
MAAMLVDSESLNFVRELIVSGRYDPALAALDQLTARSPKSEDRQATDKQRWYLSSLTGVLPGWQYWKNSLLPLNDAKRMIDELLSDGETTYGKETYKLCEKAAKKHGKNIQANDGIPW